MAASGKTPVPRCNNRRYTCVTEEATIKTRSLIIAVALVLLAWPGTVGAGVSRPKPHPTAPPYPYPPGFLVVKPLCISPLMPDALRVRKTVSSFPEPGVLNLQPFDRTVSYQSPLRRLYRLVCSLPLASLQGQSCGAGFGVTYHLTFRHGRHVLLRVSADSSGCGGLYHGAMLGRTRPFSLNGPYYDLLFSGVAKALKVREENLAPYRLPRQYPTVAQLACDRSR